MASHSYKGRRRKSLKLQTDMTCSRVLVLAQKLDIIQALQKGGLTVAMTGDGTNDAPALRAADIGIAMGRHGTTAAREIADVVLAEDDLSTMVVAVRQGRMIYANMRKAIHFLVSTNSSEVFVTVGAAACGLGQPLNAGQLLWLNLVTDVAIAYSLGFEPVEYDVMQRPPRPRDENIVRRSDYPRLALKSGLFSISALSAHLYGMARYGTTGGGIAFSTLIGAQLLDGLSSRSETRAPWSLPANRALTLAILGTAGLQGLVSVMPFSRRLLGLAAFSMLDLGVIAAGSVLPFLIIETMIKPNAAGVICPALMIRLIAVAVAAYISTNIDDLLLLCAFCAHPAYSTTQIVAGQFIGIGILVVASCDFALTSVVIPLPYIGLLGVAPIYLGCSRVLTRSKSVQRPTSSSRQTLAVITATIADGGDNIATYVPIFAGSDGTDPGSRWLGRRLEFQGHFNSLRWTDVRGAKPRATPCQAG